MFTNAALRDKEEQRRKNLNNLQANELYGQGSTSGTQSWQDEDSEYQELNQLPKLPSTKPPTRQQDLEQPTPSISTEASQQERQASTPRVRPTIDLGRLMATARDTNVYKH